MDIGRIGVWSFLDSLPAAGAAQFARDVETLGYRTLWIPEALGRDAMVATAWLLSSTRTLNVATGIANVYARDAVTTAAAAKSLAELSAGRFVLGLGVSHRPLVEGIRGHRLDNPFEYMRAYLDKMAGAPYVASPPTEDPPVVIGALHPKMLALSAEKARGAHPYLVPPEHTAFARNILGKGPWLCPEQKVLMVTDAARARGVARQAIAMYLGLPNYRRSLTRFGYGDTDLDGGGSDRLVDAVVAWGDEKRIAERVRAHLDAGADHVCIQPLDPDGLPRPDRRVLEAFAPARGATI
jgi:probable F420-dependent oxidoreductase